MPHLYTYHVYVLPVTIAALLTLHLALVVYQKHTQFVPDETRVVGRRFWPDYALRTLAAFAVTIAVVLALSALIEINPITVYGRYHDWIVLNRAVPDWYAAFLEGGLRLGPAVELRIFGHPIPALLWPGFVLPTIVLIVLLCWPWIDRRITGDEKAHDVLVPPTVAPWRVGVGASLIAAGVILTLAASDDQQADALHISVVALVWFYRIALPVVGIGAGFLAATFARELRARREHRAHQERVVALRRNAEGGFDEEKPQAV